MADDVDIKGTLLRFRWPIAVVVLAALVFLMSRAKTVEVEMTVIGRGPIEEYVTEEAETQLDIERMVAADRAGTMDRIALEVGDTVTKGQIVCSIEDTEFELSLGALRDRLAEVQARLDGVDVPLPKQSEIDAAEAEHRGALKQVEVLKEEKTAAKANLDYAEGEFRRIEGLLESGSATDRQHEQARRDETVAGAVLAGVNRRLSAAETAVEVAALRKQVLVDSLGDTAHLHRVYGAQHDGVQKQIALLEHEAQIKSPIDGIVMVKHLDSEQFVLPGTPLLTIGDLASIEIRSDILSEEVGRVKMGQKVLLVGKAVAGRGEIANPAAIGRVKQVYPSGFTKISSLGVRQQRVVVLIDFDNSELGLGPGYELDVQIAVDTKEDALLVPGEAVFATAEGSGIFVIDGGRAGLRQITTGLQGEDYYEVLNGLEPGETVILRPPTNLEDGARVKVVGD